MMAAADPNLAKPETHDEIDEVLEGHVLDMPAHEPLEQLASLQAAPPSRIWSLILWGIVNSRPQFITYAMTLGIGLCTILASLVSGFSLPRGTNEVRLMRKRDFEAVVLRFDRLQRCLFRDHIPS
jgi:hypothetical protein